LPIGLLIRRILLVVIAGELLINPASDTRNLTPEFGSLAISLQRVRHGVWAILFLAALATSLDDIELCHTRSTL
jgi:hypothetical protein